MKINNINLTKQIDFGSGKTKIYSDFDGTFMPDQFNHDVICNNSSELNKDAFDCYFDNFGHFLQEDSDGDKKISLTITTGRNLHEFNYFMTKIREKGLEIPIPDSLITTNGGDEYLNYNKNFFDSEDHEMFKPDVVNFNKQEDLKKFIISWDIKGIKKVITDFISKLTGKPKLLEPATHQGLYGYKNGLSLQETIEKQDEPTKANYVSLRKDGSYQIRLTAPIGSGYIEEFKKLEKELKDDGYVVDFNAIEKDGETFVNKADKPNEWELGGSINIRPKTKGKVETLNKFHHVKLMSDKIQEGKLDDLVIVCGDGSNDLTMLNLSNYIDEMQDSKDFSKEEFKEKVRKLPIMAIFVKNNSHNNIIYEYEKDFNFDGIKRFIIVDKNDKERPQTLLEAIKLAQEEYSKMNINYQRNK